MNPYVQNTFKSPISVFLSFPLNTFQWSIFIIEYMRRNRVYRVYAKELIIIYLNLIQVDRQSQSAILWILISRATGRANLRFSGLYI